MNKLYLNIGYQHTTDQDFDYLSQLEVQPEFYFSGGDIDRITNDDLARLAAKVDEFKLEPSIHAPFYDLNLGAIDSQIQKTTLARMEWAFVTAKRLNAHQIVIHPGYGPISKKQDFSSWLERAKPVIENLIEMAEKHQVKIAFENIFDDRPDNLELLLKTVPSKMVGICLDVGHFNVFSQVRMQTWLDTLGEHIIELHLHDNDGESDQHLAIGDGNFNFSPIKKWLKTLSPEAWPQLTLELSHKSYVVKSVNLIKSWF